MSTDYGLKCLDSIDEIIPENCLFYPLPDVLKIAGMFADLSRAVRVIKDTGSLDIQVSAYWCPEQFEEFLAWTEKHHKHRLMIVDEYGNDYPTETPTP